MPPSTPISAAVLTVSDRCARNEAVDTSGPALVAILRDRLHATIAATACVPDEPDLIERRLREWSVPTRGINLIVTTGGTGLAPRDRTTDAAMRVIDRPHPALMELARARTLHLTPLTYLSRSVAGAANSTLILTFPGSPKGAVQYLESLLDVLPHALHTLAGGEGHP